MTDQTTDNGQMDSITDLSQLSTSNSSQIQKPVAKQFTCFPSLPVELLQLIWEFAALQPQINIVRIAPHAGVWYPLTGLSSFQFISKEARNAFLRVRRDVNPWIRLKTTAERVVAAVFDNSPLVKHLAPQWKNAYILAPKPLVDPAIDTVWMTMNSLKMCKIARYWVNIHIQRLALGCNAWMDFVEAITRKWKSSLFAIGIKDVIFIVGDTSSNVPVSNITLVEPTAPPSILLNERFWKLDRSDDDYRCSRQYNTEWFRDDCTWERLERAAVGKIESAREENELARIEALDPETMAEYSPITITSVRFMEAVTWAN